ncbi:WecB/TagA/CpsF family glycosyltransferase [Vibrio campbellii]
MNWLDDKINNTEGFSSFISNFDANKRSSITFVNPFSYFKLIDDEKFKGFFDAVYIDGISLVRLHNFRFNSKVARTSFDFSSIAHDVFHFAQSNDMTIAIVGSTDEELEIFMTNLSKMYPKIKIGYSHSGYFDETRKNEIFEELEDSLAEILIVGMGTPYQENFIFDLFHFSGSKFMAFTCGGFISQTAIKADYYHPLVKKLGLMWLQRAFLHSHVRKRLVVDYPKFFIKYCYRAIFNK